MSAFTQVLIGGYPGGGLTTDKKPLMLPNEAFSTLENAYVWRDRVKKRDGSVSMGRLTRIFSAVSIGNSGTSPWSFNLFSKVSPAIIETYAEIVPGSLAIFIGTYTFTDQGNGTFALTGTITNATQATLCQITSANHHLTTGQTVTINNVVGMTQLNGNTYTITVVNANNFTIGVNSTGYGAYVSGGTWISVNNTNFGTINYVTGAIVITTTASSGTAATATFGYYPTLPVMGISKRDVPTIGIDQTVFFDTTYAYQYSNGFIQLGTTTWTGSDTDFFWTCNYQGATADLRYFFATNDNIDIAASKYDPIYYFNNSTWTALQPLITATTTLWQALILIPYYGRLLALNTWEGPTTGSSPPYSGATNFFSRCRFSQLGDPTDQTNGWRSDIFGRGGYLDAPTNEAIVSVAFFRNVLVVFFEYSTWQLRYIGEYGLPFIFERISSDFGAVSTFSSIIFDQGVMAISNRGVIQASASGVTRLDEKIPENVFSFEIQNDAPNFVHGIRDFEKELVYWNYLDAQTAQMYQNWPTNVLVFNYRNNTWAIFRDTITCFGPAQYEFGITWDSLTTFWESTVSWDNVDDQQYVEYVTCGNQQGFISIYENPDAETPQPALTLYAPTLSITAINTSTYPNPAIFTIPQHNLANGEVIYITNALWSGTDPGINNQIYNVTATSDNTITLGKWDQASESYIAFSINTSSTYIGGGLITLFPVMNIVGKDFNPFQEKGKQFKLSYIDFQADSNLASPGIPAVTVQLFVNSYLGEQANFPFGNQELLNSSQQCGYITNVYTGINTTDNPSNPCTITSPGYSLPTGTLIRIGNIIGTTQLNTNLYNITVVDQNNFTLDGVDATGFTTYISGGTWTAIPIQGQTYLSGSQYAWYRFYSTQYGQYLRIAITYDSSLMNQLSTQQLPFELNAMNLWMREGGRLVN